MLKVVGLFMLVFMVALSGLASAQSKDKAAAAQSSQLSAATQSSQGSTAVQTTAKSGTVITHTTSEPGTTMHAPSTHTGWTPKTNYPPYHR